MDNKDQDEKSFVLISFEAEGEENFTHNRNIKKRKKTKQRKENFELSIIR